jgi:anaerobic magnesium-protoporphyrin IX monomethyl ester cyclase
MISTNRELAPQPVLPIGAAWVAQALCKAGFAVRFLDLCFERNPLRLVTETVREFSPDGIGISIRNLDNCDFLAPKSFLPEIRELTDLLKSRTGAPILLGGAGASIMPTELLEYLDLDYAVAGEGEEAAVRFFRAGDGGGRGAIPGLVSRSEPGPVKAGEQPVTPRVMPQLHRWVDTGRYLRFEPIIPVQGKRGCANRCLYCTYSAIEGKEWRPRPPAEVVEEIAATIADTRAREFEFVDSVFNQPEGYLEALLEEIIRSRLKARFHVSSLSPRGLTREQLRLLERAGTASVVITPEAAADATLAALRKDFTEEDVVRAAELLSGSGIKALWCFLLGGPEEDGATLTKTIGFINRKIGRKDGAYLTTGIRIYPGTGLHRLAIGEGVVAAGESLLMPSFYFTPRLTPRQAMEMLRRGVDDPGRCIFPADTGLGPVGTLRRLGAALKLPTPFWQYAGYLNAAMRRRRAINRSWPGGAS